MTVIAFPTRTAPRPATDDTLRAICERLMRRLVREKRTPEADMRAFTAEYGVMPKQPTETA